MEPLGIMTLVAVKTRDGVDTRYQGPTSSPATVKQELGSTPENEVTAPQCDYCGEMTDTMYPIRGPKACAARIGRTDVCCEKCVEYDDVLEIQSHADAARCCCCGEWARNLSNAKVPVCDMCGEDDDCEQYTPFGHLYDDDEVVERHSGKKMCYCCSKPVKYAGTMCDECVENQFGYKGHEPRDEGRVYY